MNKNKAAGIGAVLLAVALIAGIAIAQENQNNSIGQENTILKIVNHLCGAHIANLDDFNYISTDKDDLSAYIAMIHTCPTVIIPGDSSSENPHKVHEMEFGLEVEASNISRVIDDAEVMPDNICASDVNESLFTGSTECLDLTGYSFGNLPENLSVAETLPPGNSRLGAAIIAPEEINEDSFSLSRLQISDGIVMVNASDGVLHLFNFINSGNLTSGNETGKNITENETNQEDFMQSFNLLNAQGWAVSQQNGYLARAVIIGNNESSGEIIHLITGQNGGKYRLTEHNSFGNALEFNLSNSLLLNSTGQNSTSIGTLAIIRIPRSDFTLWEGILVINENSSGALAGEYHIELGSGANAEIRNADEAFELINSDIMNSALERQSLQEVIDNLRRA